MSVAMYLMNLREATGIKILKNAFVFLIKLHMKIQHDNLVKTRNKYKP